jgi:restriction system protein
VLTELAASALRRTTNEGTLIRATTLLFDDIVRELGKDWSRVLDYSSDQREEIVVGYFHRIQYEVTHTPRSGDLGRDLIARKNGFGAVKILGSVKRYAPGQPVPAAAVRELMGVLDLDKGASKAMLFTTSDFD